MLSQVSAQWHWKAPLRMLRPARDRVVGVSVQRWPQTRPRTAPQLSDGSQPDKRKTCPLWSRWVERNLGQQRSWLSEEVQTKGPRCAFDSVMDPSLLCEVMDHLLHQMSNSTFINDWVQNSQLCHLQVMFEDNGGGAGGPLDNLTEDDIVLLDGDYDEVRESVVIQFLNSKYFAKICNIIIFWYKNDVQFLVEI